MLRKSPVVAVTVILAFVGCSRLDQQTAPGTETSRSVDPGVAASVVSMSAPPHTGMQFAAQIHTDMMQEFMSKRAAIRKLHAKGRCASIAGIIRDHFPQIAAATGESDSAQFEGSLSQALINVGCATGRVTRPHGALEAYRGALEGALATASSPGDAAANLDAVVASDKTQSPADHSQLVALASLGASSVYYWSKVQADGGLPADGTAQLLMIRYDALCGTACKIGWADLGGGLLGAMGGGLVGSIISAGVTSAIEAL